MVNESQLGQMANPFHDQEQRRKRAQGFVSNQSMTQAIDPQLYGGSPQTQTPTLSAPVTPIAGTPEGPGQRTPRFGTSRPPITPTPTPATPPPVFTAPQTSGAGGGGTPAPGGNQFLPQPQPGEPRERLFRNPTPPTTPPVTPVTPVTTPAPGSAPQPVTREAFDAKGYVNANPDVFAAIARGEFGGDPYRHYIEYGFKEGRPGATAAVPGTTPGAATTPPANLPAPSWKTDGYKPPAFSVTPTGSAPPGWDQTKWSDPNHQTPKYGVGRILNKYPPTVAGLQQALAEVQKAYPGTTSDGKDKLNIPGVGTIDVLVGASQGGVSWAWQDTAAQQGQAQGGPDAQTAPGNTALSNVFAPLGGLGNGPQYNIQSVIAQILAQLAAGGGYGR